MADTGWLPIAGTAIGGVVALAGTLVAGARADRGQRSRDREADRLRTYVDFALALDGAHAALRDIAATEPTGSGRPEAAERAVGDSGLYGVRERLLMSATVEMVTAGEAAFDGLIGIGDVVRAGARRRSREYHDAYHGFAESLWAFRMAVRREVGQKTLVPATLGKSSWSEREQCPECGRPAVGADSP